MRRWREALCLFSNIIVLFLFGTLPVQVSAQLIDRLNGRRTDPVDPLGLVGPHQRHMQSLSTGVETDSNFTVLGRWAWGPCQAVDVRGNYAYIGNGLTFHVLNVSDPQTPTIVGEYVADWIIYDIRLRDTLAFVATEATLLILNIANPQLPT